MYCKEVHGVFKSYFYSKLLAMGRGSGLGLWCKSCHQVIHLSYVNDLGGISSAKTVTKEAHLILRFLGQIHRNGNCLWHIVRDSSNFIAKL